MHEMTRHPAPPPPPLSAHRHPLPRLHQGAAPPRHPPVPVPRPNTPHGAGHWQVEAAPGQNVMLLPGQMSFTTAPATLRTLLGSCVSITIWHPARRIGGMCHYLLPQRQRRSGDTLDGRYGDEALEAMVERLLRTRTRPSEYIAHLYGGADTMPDGQGVKFNVGERNIEAGWTLIDKYGFQLDGVDVGEDVPRTVSIELASGTVNMRRGAGKASTMR